MRTGPCNPSLVLIQWRRVCNAQTKRGGEGEGLLVTKNFVRVYTWNYSGAQFIVPRKGRSRIPFQILAPQGTGKTISTYHVGLRHGDRDCDRAIGPSIYVRNGFLGVFCHESTKILENDSRILPEHAIHWEDQLRKLFMFTVLLLNVIVLIFLPIMIPELIHWLILVVNRIRIAKYDLKHMKNHYWNFFYNNSKWLITL